MLLEIVRSFRPSTVHGINELWHRLSIKSVIKRACVAICLAFGVWEISNTISNFLTFSVKTTTEVVNGDLDGVPFPAITFCSSNVGLKSFLGGSPSQRDALLLILSRTSDLKTLKEMSSACEDPSVPVYDAASSDADMVGVVRESMVDSVRAVKNCQWNSKDLNCSRLFINKATDSGICFTFNPDLELLKNYRLLNSTDDLLENILAKTTYGTSVQESIPLISKNTGMKNGLSLTLLTNTTEYCGSRQERGGFFVVVHDRTAEPLLEMTKVVMLSPGFSTNVAMSLQKVERKTESYGFCVSSLSLRMYKGKLSYTSSDYFAQNCISESIMLNCKCVPFYNPRTNTFQKNEVNEVVWLGSTNSTKVPTCGIDSLSPITDLQCQMKVEKKLFDANSTCYYPAPKPCKQTIFRTQVSFTKYPTMDVLPSLNRKLATNFTLEQFRMNFVFANFFYRDNKFIKVTEKIRMTWVDLMNQMGGAAGMTMGISIIGLVEIIFWLSTLPLVIISKLHNRANKRSLFGATIAYHH